MQKQIIYYTSNQLEEPILSRCQKYIKEARLPIISCSLQPIDMGENIVLDLEPSYLTMLRQILTGLWQSTADYVFLCEHDVLYPKSHFEFTPPRDDIYYYNDNTWRWEYPKDHFVTYDRLISLSGLCANRKLLHKHFAARMNTIIENGWDTDHKREPQWARRWGYEPGTKKTKRGGFSDEDYDVWTSKDPMIDIRHGRTFSLTKCRLEDFKHPPEGWIEAHFEDIPWNLKEIFNL